MTCRKCGYRNDFLKECPCHEPSVAERVDAIRERKRKEALAEGAKNMEAFMKWIEDEINPWRQNNGLCAIGYDEQVRCYEILQAFHAKGKGKVEGESSDEEAE